MLGEASGLLGESLGELVPTEAQVHLLNAQRELLLAVSLTLQHHLRQRQAAEAADGTGKKRSRRPVRVELE